MMRCVQFDRLTAAAFEQKTVWSGCIDQARLEVPSDWLFPCVDRLNADGLTVSPVNFEVVSTMLTKLFFRLLFWSALVFAFVMAGLPQPPALPGNPSDKVQHILAFLALSSLAALAYPRIPLIVVFFGLAIFGGAIEAVQAIPNLGRDPSWLDWLADVVAVAVVLLFVGVFRSFSRKADSGS